jgi:hypothetical protein
MLPDLRLLIPATVAAFLVAAAAGLFASIRVAQDSIEVHADGRIATEQSAFTRISMSWPMPGANRAIAMQELSAFVRQAALAPLKAAVAVEPAVAAPARLTVEKATPPQAEPEPLQASLDGASPIDVKIPPEPASASDGRPDLPPLANEPHRAAAEVTPATTSGEAQKNDVAALNEPEGRESHQAKDIAKGPAEPEPTIASTPDEMGSTRAVTRSEGESESIRVDIPLPVVASRSREPENVTKVESERTVPDVVVRKPRRTRRSRIVQRPPKPKIKPAPDITELEPYERYSRSPANIFYTAVY